MNENIKHSPASPNFRVVINHINDYLKEICCFIMYANLQTKKKICDSKAFCHTLVFFAFASKTFYAQIKVSLCFLFKILLVFTRHQWVFCCSF